MNETQKRIIRTQYKPGCWLLASFPKRESTGGEFLVKSIISFLYDAGEYAAEWEAEHGPIQVWHKCNQGDENSREHYFYDFTDSGPMNWSQLAVERSGLPPAANRGDYDHIFDVLKGWAKQ